MLRQAQHEGLPVPTALSLSKSAAAWGTPHRFPEEVGRLRGKKSELLHGAYYTAEEMRAG